MIGQNSSATTNTKSSFIAPFDEPSFLALAAKVFGGSMPARTVAIVASYPGEGTTFVSEALGAFLSFDRKKKVSIVSSEEFLASTSNPSSPDYLESESVHRAGTVGDEIVLVDCPALFTSSSAIRVSPNVDGVLIVIQDGARSKGEIQRAVSMVEAAEGRILGAILNKRRYLLPDWLYSLLR